MYLKPFSWPLQENPPLEYLIPLLDSLVDTKIKKQTFLDPFIGNGEVFLNFNKLSSYFLGDIYYPIVSLFELLQQNFNIFLQQNTKAFLPENNSRQAFLNFKEQYNCSNVAESVYLLPYLMSHARANSIVFNKEGKLIEAQYEDSVQPVNMWHVLQNKMKKNEISFFPGSFLRIMKAAQFGDIIYCCPPRLYNGKIFTDEDQKLLAGLCDQAALRGAKIVLAVQGQRNKLYKNCSWHENLEGLSGNKLIVVYDY